MPPLLSALALGPRQSLLKISFAMHPGCSIPEINKRIRRHLPFDKRRVHHGLHDEIYLLNTTTPQADEENLGSQEISASDYSCIGRPLLLCKLFLGCHPRIFFQEKKIKIHFTTFQIQIGNC